jgi:hypothetical protein
VVISASDLLPTSGQDTWTLSRSGSDLSISRISSNGTSTVSLPAGQSRGLWCNLDQSTDTVVLDYSNGDPLSGMLPDDYRSILGSYQSDGRVSVIGTSGDDTITIAGSFPEVTVNGSAFICARYPNASGYGVGQISVQSGDGNDYIDVGSSAMSVSEWVFKGGAGTDTLNWYASSGNASIAIDTVNVLSGCSLTIDSSPLSSILMLNLNGALNVNGQGSVLVTTLNIASGASGIIDVTNGSFALIQDADVSGTASFNVTTNATVEVFDFTASGTVNVNGDAVTGAEMMTVSSFNVTGSVNVNAHGILEVYSRSSIHNLNVVGTGATAYLDTSQDVDNLAITNGGFVMLKPRLTGAANILFVHSGFTLGSPSGTLDLGDGDLVVQGGDIGNWNGTAYTGIAGYIQSGFNGGSWDGLGIISSSATTSNRYTTLGIATLKQVKGLSSPTDSVLFAGETVTGGDVLVKFTYGGDANLDGKINVDDYGRIDSNVGQNGSVFGWYNGDFNYDGKINVDDYGIIDANIGVQGPPIPTDGASAAPAGVSAVPEPAALGLAAAALGLAALRGRRRDQP